MYLETWNGSNFDLNLLTQALLQLPWLSLALVGGLPLLQLPS